MFLAHISEDRARQQSISDHLYQTARLAGDFAAAFKMKEWGYGFGLYHDIGKYSLKFQNRLQGGSMTDHATAGAQELFRLRNIAGYAAAYCISGHHSGLLDGGGRADVGGEATLMGRMSKRLEPYQDFHAEIEEPRFTAPSIRPMGKGGFSLSFLIRMLFSCLVDADYLDTESFMKDGQEERGCYDSIQVLHQRLRRYISKWLEKEDQDTVNGRRTMILKACLERGGLPRGLFSLTVPTGGGKTISSLAFALEHARKHQLDRVIYVIPYTSIIEQNAQVFRDILGEKNVLEHHSSVSYPDGEEAHRAALASENWDCPVVVTTNVQFFESLFGNSTSGCRKLHNIANSVLIFDEAQMLPVPYLKPCIRAIAELVRNYHSTAVLCTATQPALKPYFPEDMPITELCPDVRGQSAFFRRTVFERAGVLSEEALAGRIREKRQVLCILNSRKAVQRVYGRLEDAEGIFHLSTFMYPRHRKEILQRVRERLKEGLPCRLIAASLVEAGVDLDFPAVYREMAGIDSMIQAAGRCNREGKRRAEEGRTVLFALEKEESGTPRTLRLPIRTGEQVMEEYEDIGSPEAVEAYFTRLYYLKGEELDARDIIDRMERESRSWLFPFASVAREFIMIEENTQTILIDREEAAAHIAARIRRGEYSRELMREAGSYSVNVYESDLKRMEAAGLLEPLDQEIYVLRRKELYTEEMGLLIEAERGDALFV